MRLSFLCLPSADDPLHTAQSLDFEIDFIKGKANVYLIEKIHVL